MTIDAALNSIGECLTEATSISVPQNQNSTPERAQNEQKNSLVQGLIKKAKKSYLSFMTCDIYLYLSNLCWPAGQISSDGCLNKLFVLIFFSSLLLDCSFHCVSENNRRNKKNLLKPWHRKFLYNIFSCVRIENSLVILTGFNPRYDECINGLQMSLRLLHNRKLCDFLGVGFLDVSSDLF